MTVCHFHSHPKRTSVWNHLIYFSTELHNTNCTFGHKINTFYTTRTTSCSWRWIWLGPYSILNPLLISRLLWSGNPNRGKRRSVHPLEWLFYHNSAAKQLFVSRCLLYSTMQYIQFNYVHHIVGSFKIMQTINLPVEQKCLFNSNKHHDVVLIVRRKKANKRTTNGTGDTKMNKTTKVRTQNIVSNFKRFFPFSDFISVHASNYLFFCIL